VRLSVLVTLGAALGACGAADGKPREDGPDELVADSTALWMPSGTDSQTKLKLCWDSSAFATGANAKKFADARAAAVDEIRKTWIANSWVRITWSDTCSGDMVKVRVEDAQPNGDPYGARFNFTFANWDPGCAKNETERLSCIRTNAVHEFGHILAFPHEQNRTNGHGIVCANGTRIPMDAGKYSITQDWDVTGIDTESIMSYCGEGQWTGSLSSQDIEGLRALYGGDQNPILANSQAAIRNSDKTFWNGPSGMGAHMAVANVVRRSAGADGLAYGQTISVEIGGAFLCGRKGRAGTSPTSPGIVWNKSFDSASCSWTISRTGSAAGDDELDVNDPFDLALTLPASNSTEITFQQKYSRLRMLRVLPVQ